MNIYEYIIYAIAYFYYVFIVGVRFHVGSWISKVFEGIAIGIYANLIGDIVKTGPNIKLLYLFIFAIILTIISLKLSNIKES